MYAHHPDCGDPGPCAEGCWIAELDRQSGVSKSSTVERVRVAGVALGQGAGWNQHANRETTLRQHGGEGGASRFFPTFRYQAKAATRERPKVDGVSHPTVKPLELIRWLVRLVTPPGGTVLDPFLGSGTTAEACELEGFAWVGCESNADYLPLIEQRLARVAAVQGRLDI